MQLRPSSFESPRGHHGVPRTGSRRRLRARALALAATTATLAGVVMSPQAVGAATDSPVPVTAYSGFNPILSRAPYVTDLTQTTAYVNWATTSMTPGSAQVAATVNGVCPTSTTLSGQRRRRRSPPRCPVSSQLRLPSGLERDAPTGWLAVLRADRRGAMNARIPAFVAEAAWASASLSALGIATAVCSRPPR